MVKIIGPLHSDEASGTICDFLTFSKRKSGQQCRWQKKQKIVTPSQGQADVQTLYRVIYARWLAFSDSQRKVFDDEAKSKNLSMSGWNLFLKKAMIDPAGQLGLAGYWSFNRKGLGTVSDLSKNGNTGTLMPSWPGNSPQYVDSKNKKMLNCLSFDGIDDYVNCGNDASFDITDAITIGAWVKTNINSGNRFIVSKWIGFSLESYRDWSPKGEFVIQVDGGIRTLNFEITHIDGKWHYLVGTYSSATKTMKVYLDGVEDNSITLSGLAAYTMATSNNDLNIGRFGGNYFNGSIDGVRIYNRVLSAPEIKNLYNLFK